MDVRMQKNRVVHWLGSATRAHMDVVWDSQYKANLMTSAQPVHKSQCSTTKKGRSMVQMRIERTRQAIQVSLRLILSNASRAMLFLVFVSPAFADGCYEVGGTQTVNYPGSYSVGPYSVTVTVPANLEVCNNSLNRYYPPNFTELMNVAKIEVTGATLLPSTYSEVNWWSVPGNPNIVYWVIHVMIDVRQWMPNDVSFYFPSCN